MRQIRGADLPQTSTRPPAARSGVLPPQAEVLDQLPISLDVLFLQVVQEPPTPADEPQETPARVVVLLVRPEVLGELLDPARQERDLHLRRAGVGVAGC